MKKISFFIAAVLLLLGSANAQTEMFEKGTQLFKVGIGYTAVGFPIELSYEKGIKDDLFGVEGFDLGVGGYFGYFGYEEEFTFDFDGSRYSWKYTNIIVGARAIGHYQIFDKLDTYSGVMLGYNVAKATFEGDPDLEDLIDDVEVGGFTYSGVVGIRYEFNPKMGAYLEAGFGVANVTGGIAFKF